MPTISGIVKDVSGTPCEALVVAYRRSDMSLSGMVFSNQSTGAYSITTVDSSPHVVMRFFGTPGSLNAYYRRLGLHFSGANNSTSIVDVCGKTITVHGDAKIDAVTTDPYGGTTGILSLDGSGDYLTVSTSPDFNLVGKTFSLRAKIKPEGSGDRHLFGYNNASATDYWDAYINTSGNVVFRYAGSSGSLTSTTTVTNSVWNDIELSFDGTNTRIFTNGNSGGSVASGVTKANGNYSLSIGANLYGGAYWNYFNGKMKDVEFLIGTALHTSAFTPPSSTFIDYLAGIPTENAQIFDYVTPV